MFTGLIQSMAEVIGFKGSRLTVTATLPKPDLGESIALNGVCLTVKGRKRQGPRWFLDFDLSPETLNRTTFSSIRPGDQLNLERCATLHSLLGGHLVQGHVNGIGRVASIQRQGEYRVLVFQAPKDLMKYIVPKGSISVNGVSLTAVDVKSTSFSVALVPHTLSHTNLGALSVKDAVNLEVDIMAKHIEKLLKNR